MQGLVEDKASGEGAEFRETDLIETMSSQMVLTGLDRLTPYSRRIAEGVIEYQIKRSDGGEITDTDSGNRERVAAGEGRGVRRRHPVRPHRTNQ